MAGAVLLAVLLRAADDRIVRLPSPAAVRVSSGSPFTDSCDGTQTGIHYRNSEVEAWVAIDPANHLHLAGVWQQDRWSNGGASGLVTAVSQDGGQTWTPSLAPFSRCAGGATEYDRSSDPWITFAPDGTAHQIGLALTPGNTGQAILVSRSVDGGFHWSDAITLIRDVNPDVSDDKESITADPHDARFVYAVWDRLSGLTSRNFVNFRGPAWFSRTTDGGASWEPPRIIYDAGVNAQTIANQIVVLPDGTLINLFTLIRNATAPLVRDEQVSLAVIRSQDRGATWSEPIVISTNQAVGVSDVKTGAPLRTGAILASIAVDPASGALYVVWEDGRFSNLQREGIAFARSTDGGLTWASPVQVNQVPDVQAFTPAVAVGRGGAVAVTYYDFRKDTPDPTVLLASYWRILSVDGGNTWNEVPLSEPFDFTPAASTGSSGLFLGDYQGLAPSGNSFLSFFAVAGSAGNPSDVIATTRPSGTDRSSNGRTEINRYLLRRKIRPPGAEPVPDRKRR